MVRTIPMIFVCLVMLAVSVGQVQAAVIYDESISGDLASFPATVLGSLAAGTNTILGTATGSPSLDLDGFQFSIPVGFELIDITVSATEQGGNFFNLRFDLFAGSGYGGSNLENVLLSGIPSDTDSFSVTPLAAGIYTIGQNQLSSNHIMDYSVTLEVNDIGGAVPEPSSLALLGVGVCLTGCGVVSRRRREKKNV